MHKIRPVLRLFLAISFSVVISACGGSGGGSAPGEDADTTAPITTATPPGGNYTSPQTVVLSSNESGTTISYSLDGGSTLQTYNSPLLINSTTTLNFLGVDSAGNAEAINTEIYTITLPPADTTAAITTANPVGGLFNSPQSIALTANEAATIYFTTDGSTPTTSSTVYNTPVAITATATLRYFSVDSAGNTESAKLQAYTIDTVAPSTVAVPEGGSYSTAQSVVLTANESSSIYYTTDGSAPTTSSTVYSSPVPIAATATLRYFAVDAAGNAEAVNTQNYTIDPNIPTTTANPPAGTYNTSQSVALAADKPGATIYFTTDGSTPTTASTVYVSPISVSSTTTVRFFADDGLGNIESVKTQTYTIDTTSPVTTANPAGGTYNIALNVTLTANEAGTTYFTLDGSNPTTASPVYSSPIPITSSTTLKYFTRDVAGNNETIKTETYTIDNVAPVTTANPVGGSFSTAQSVTLTANETANIYYTTDGSIPTTSSTVYSTQISITATSTLRYFAVDTAGNVESVKSQTYTIDTVAPVTTAIPSGGLFNTSQSVALIPGETATIYFTADGSTPTTSSTVYSSPVAITATATLRYFAVDTVGNAEAVKSQTYTIDAVAPVTTASPPGGSFASAQSVTLSANETATIYFTTDGSSPSTSSTVYSSPISITVTTTLRFFGVDTAGNAETPGNSETYTFPDNTPPVTTASPVAGTYTAAINVTLSSNEAATIYFTSDGSTPTTSSTIYSSPISISATTTLKYFAVDTAGNIETPDKEAAYVINLTAATAPMNDTGVDYGGAVAFGNSTDCSGETIAQQDCSHGRDFTNNDDSDGHAGFSFTKLDASGNDLPSSAVSWSCVRDNITGLVWEVKTDDGGIHDKDNNYLWGGISEGLTTPSGSTGWNALVNGANTENSGSGLCGFTDWRVPSKEEMRSIISYDRKRSDPTRLSPTIDITYFPSLLEDPATVSPDSNEWWTSSPGSVSGANAWRISLTDGREFVVGRTFSHHVRLVRGGP